MEEFVFSDPDPYLYEVQGGLQGDWDNFRLNRDWRWQDFGEWRVPTVDGELPAVGGEDEQDDREVLKGEYHKNVTEDWQHHQQNLYHRQTQTALPHPLPPLPIPSLRGKGLPILLQNHLLPGQELLWQGEQIAYRIRNQNPQVLTHIIIGSFSCMTPLMIAGTVSSRIILYPPQALTTKSHQFKTSNASLRKSITRTSKSLKGKKKHPQIYSITQLISQIRWTITRRKDSWKL